MQVVLRLPLEFNGQMALVRLSGTVVPRYTSVIFHIWLIPTRALTTHSKISDLIGWNPVGNDSVRHISPRSSVRLQRVDIPA